MSDDYFDDLLDSLYDDWVDHVASTPLLPHNRSPNQTIQTALQLNNQLVTNVLNIRRHFETSATYTPPPVYTNWSTQILRSSATNQEDLFPTNHYHQQQQQERPRTRRQPVMDTENMFRVFENLIDNIIETYANSANETTGQELEDVKVTLTAEQFEKLHTVPLDDATKAVHSQDICNICMEGFNEGHLTQLPCKHFFHKDCVHLWLCQEKVSCPVCRADVRDAIHSGLK